MQTFCVSCNGYAWYQNGVVPEQPGLKHDFLTEAVRLGHKDGLRVMGYFCIGSNTRWGRDHPELSYGIPSSPHLPYTDEYLSYLGDAIRDAVQRTGIDGFMIDWLWQPERKSTGGKWLDCEKRLYAQLTGQPFPGEDKLTAEQEIAYSRQALDRCWSTIHKAAKEANPACILWLSSHSPTHPHLVHSRMYQEIDWLMNEGGDIERVEAVKPMIGKHTRLITCLANWNRQDPTAIVPVALRHGIGLYGFTKPQADSLVPLEPCLTQPVRQLSGDARNLARCPRLPRHRWIPSGTARGLCGGTEIEPAPPRLVRGRAAVLARCRAEKAQAGSWRRGRWRSAGNRSRICNGMRSRGRVVLRRVVQHQDPVDRFARIWRREGAFARVREFIDGRRLACTRIEPPGFDSGATDLVQANSEGSADGA